MTLRLFRASASVVSFAAVAALLIGCGSSGDSATRYDLSGTVTFQGRPVPAGEISFTPDNSQGNSGPGATASIVDGKYATPAGLGVIGGPHLVRITGISGGVAGAAPAPGAADSAPPGPLFPEYQTTVDLPKQSHTQDFEVPAE